MYYDKESKIIKRKKWLELINDDDYRNIGRDVLPNGILISTIWLGLNNSLRVNPENLLIFQTLVYDKTGSVIDSWRYTKELDAIEQHKKIVSELKLKK